MAQSEMKNAPPLYGWVIGIGAGAVATGVSLVAVGIEGNGSVAIGLVIALVVGLVFTIAEKQPKPAAPRMAAPAPAPAPTAEPDPAPEARPAPMAAAAAPAEAITTAEPAAEETTKPKMLSAPVGTPDDLKQISGVGPVIEGKLNDLGVYHFWQVARWSPAEVAWVDGFLNFKGRISRDDWIGQATTLAESSPSRAPE